MAWRNALELEVEYTDPSFLDAFTGAFGLCVFQRGAILPAGYTAHRAWESAVALTPHGDEWAERLQTMVPEASAADIRFSLFRRFGYHDLLVDVAKLDTSAIRDRLHREAANARVRFPWVHGRLLYDKFCDMFASETEELTPEQTGQFLAGTPQGVFQVGGEVVGPFGLVVSKAQRRLWPVRMPPLWSCSDPSCEGLHEVLLVDGLGPVQCSCERLGRELADAMGPPSEWRGFYRHVSDPDNYYDDAHAWGLPWLVGGAFADGEVRAMAARVLGAEGAGLREALSAATGSAKRFRGSPTVVADRLTPAECLQLLLTQTDQAVVEAIDELVADGTIRVPPGETRVVRLCVPRGTWFGVRPECSQFGVRFVPSHRDVSAARLKRVLSVAYENRKEDMQWLLSRAEGNTAEAQLDSYVHSEDPFSIVNGIVRSGPGLLKPCLAAVGLELRSPLTSREQEEQLTKRILWKLGFTVHEFPAAQEALASRSAEFLNVVRTHPSRDQVDLDAIRSAGVNFFVALEQVLDLTLSFAAWALLSDHHQDTRFHFDLASARRFMASRLGGVRSRGGEDVSFDPEGRNTLYPLIRGLALLADVCQRTERRRRALRRPAEEFPGYHSRTDIERFPYLHRCLVLDLQKQDRDGTLDLLRAAARDLDQCRTCDVRNRVEHPRDDFPTTAELGEVCRCVEETMGRLAAHGLSPLVYQFERATSDRYGRDQMTFRAYNGREVLVRWPGAFHRCGLPPISVPQIIVPGIHIGDSCEPQRFWYQEQSDYTRVWEGFPKRKRRLPDAVSPDDGSSCGAPQVGNHSLQTHESAQDAPDLRCEPS